MVIHSTRFPSLNTSSTSSSVTSLTRFLSICSLSPSSSEPGNPNSLRYFPPLFAGSCSVAGWLTGLPPASIDTLPGLWDLENWLQLKRLSSCRSFPCLLRLGRLVKTLVHDLHLYSLSLRSRGRPILDTLDFTRVGCHPLLGHNMAQKMYHCISYVLLEH